MTDRFFGPYRATVDRILKQHGAAVRIKAEIEGSRRQRRCTRGERKVIGREALFNGGGKVRLLPASRLLARGYSTKLASLGLTCEMNSLTLCATIVVIAAAIATTAARDGQAGFCVPGMACSTHPFAVCECWGRLDVCCSASATPAIEQPLEQKPVAQLQRVQPLKICTGWGDTCGVDDQTCICARVPPCTCWTSSIA